MKTGQCNHTVLPQLPCHHWQKFLLHSLSADRTSKGSRAHCSFRPQQGSVIPFCSLQTKLPKGVEKRGEQRGKSLEPLSSVTSTSFHPGIHKQDIPKRWRFFKRCDLKQTVQSNEETNKPYFSIQIHNNSILGLLSNTSQLPSRSISPNNLHINKKSEEVARDHCPQICLHTDTIHSG